MANAELKIAATTQFQIEKGVALPGRNSGARKYPFPSMEVGDSFLIGNEEKASAVSNAATNWGKTNGKKFSVRKIDGGYRCWRTA